MKRKIFYLFGFFSSLVSFNQALAQQKIGSNPGTLNPGAILELESSNRGFLLPRVSLSNLSSWGLNGTATDGMMVFNTNATTGPGYYVWSGGAWTRLFTGSIPSTTNALAYNESTRVLTSTVDGVAASTSALPLATASATGLLSSSDFSLFNGKENSLTFSNGLTRTTNAITLGGTLTGATSLTLGANNFTFGGATTGKVIVSGPAGSATSGLQLSNLITGVTANAAASGQRILTVDGSGNVVLGTDFGSNNAGTVTSVTGTAPISVTTGTTTPVISISALGITSGLLADGAVTAAKLNSMSATNGQVLKFNGTAWAPAADNDTQYTAGTGLTLTGNTFSHTAHTGDVTGSTALTIASSAVNSDKIADGSIATADVANSAITYAKIQNVTGARLLGNPAATAGAVSEISVGSGLSLSAGGVLSAAPSTSLGIRRITSATTVTGTDHTIIANAFTAGFTITLPSPASATGQVLVIRKVDESSNALTFTFTGITGTNAIRVSDSSATQGVYMNTLNYTRTIRIQSDGTDWYLLD